MTTPDQFLILLAVAISAASAFTALQLVHHSRRDSTAMRGFWFAAASAAVGSGVAAANLIAMLAFRPDAPGEIAIEPALILFLAAILLSGAGLGVALVPRLPGGRFLGGAIVGFPIGAIVYGARAPELGGQIIWNPAIVSASAGAAAAIGGVALHIGLRDHSLRSQAAGAALLSVAICGHLVIGMGAPSADPGMVAGAAGAATAFWPAMAVALASLAVVVAGLLAWALASRGAQVRALASALEEKSRLAELHGLITDNATDGIVTTDSAGLIMTFNASAEQIFRCPAAEVIGKHLSILTPAADRAEYEAFFRRGRDGSDGGMAGYSREVTGLRRNGSAFPMDLRISGLRLDGRRLYIASLRDSTARRAAEKALQESRRELETALRANRAIIENSREVICTISRGGEFVQVSPHCRHVWGYSPEELAGRSFLDFVHPDDRPATRAVSKAIRGGEVAKDFENRYVRRDGSVVHMLWSAAWSEEHQLTFGIAHDNSDRKVYEDELRAAKRRAEDASRAKEDFLAVMSHEIRTPLSSIKGFSEMLADTEPLGNEQRRYLYLIRSATAVLLTVINDILDFAKIEAGQIQLETRPFRLTALVDDAVAIVRDAARKKGLDIRWSIAPGTPPWLSGDADRLRQVLLNLLNNAVKFTDTGRIELTVAQSFSAKGGGTIRFAVRDTGAGVAAEGLQHLFKRFSQADSSINRRYGGTGLGLAISKSLVEAMGGEIGVESKVGEGSTFWFAADLPASEEAAPAETTRAEASPGEAVTARILLVEDIDVNQEIAAAFLSSVGYEVEAVASGPEAILAFDNKPFDLILMDIQMPGMDGIEATRRLRALGGPAATVPIVAMTANVFQDQIARFRAAGMNDHVGKPFDRKTLVATIQRCLAGALSMKDAAPDAQAEPALFFDEKRFADLRTLMGPGRFPAMLERFAAQLTSRLTPDRTPECRSTAIGDAHSLTSAAGMFGFLALSQACRDLETLKPDDADFDQLFERCRKIRDRVVAHLALQAGQAAEMPVVAERRLAAL